MLTATDSITVYVALDSRVTSIPSWLSDWELTDMQNVNNSDVIFDIYKREVKSGEKVILGTNGQSAGYVNYTVFAVKSGDNSIIGDINIDGLVNGADAVLLQNYLLARVKFTEDQFYAGDINQDGALDVFDMVFLRQLLIK